jgi:hypothetical protein
MDGFMKYVVEIGSSAMVPGISTKFQKDTFRHSKVDKGIHRHTGNKVIS